ncbi:MAG: sulfatase-like hydrolase/transferase, partial [Verrucomicrobiae bacterium]
MKSQNHKIILMAFAVSAWLPVCLPALSQTANRPNILFILSDDHAWQAVSAYGESRHLIQTPNIDRLAQEGMRFNHFFINNALCG